MTSAASKRGSGRVTAPKAQVDFDLIAWESPDQIPPFRVRGLRADGSETVYYFVDALDEDYRFLLEVEREFYVGNVDKAIMAVLPDEDRDDFLSQKLSPKKLRALFAAYNAHYDLGTPGESSASPTS